MSSKILPGVLAFFF